MNGPDMGHYKPYRSTSVRPAKRTRDREYPEWGKLLATILDPDEVWFANVYVEAHRIEQYGVEITEDLLRNMVVKHHEQWMEQVEEMMTQSEQTAEVMRQTSVVYYMRFSDRVKIGTTTDLKRRTTVIAADEVLACEPGGYDLEQRRHAQFSRLRVRGEWFRYEGELKAHIEHLRSRQPQVDDPGNRCHT